MVVEKATHPQGGLKRDNLPGALDVARPEVEKATHPQGGLKPLAINEVPEVAINVEKATHPQGGLKPPPPPTPPAAHPS